uniref:DNA topoisomerase 1 n=1 Tax=Cyanothece sp. (strain PCC 7425 / ATCC 29141) TaxID=395961 RepID=B8HXZ7_CYAP4
MTNLLIVESPGKINKLRTILGSGWEVKASVGHIRELANDGPDSLGFDLGRDRIDCRYIPRNPRAKQAIAALKQAARQAQSVYLASDPDREGETIAWHIAEVLGLKQPQRIVFQEITATAVRTALSRPRPLDLNLVAAGRCRDCLDKLVGYKGSPLVWRLQNGAKSVGRVQSATLHLLCLREREISSFVPQTYWSVYVDYQEGFRAYYHHANQPPDPKASPEGIDEAGSQDSNKESTRVVSREAAEHLVVIARSQPHRVQQVSGQVTSKKPPPPFITSSLQQAAGSRLKFNPEYTMSLAQKLYEAGLITYMRTDSVQLSPEFCTAARSWLQEHDPENVPQRVARQRSSKAAQEGHEAIRPTDVFKSSAELRLQLEDDQFKLYVLIWTRAMASQCKSAQIRKTRILSQSGKVQWQATGQVIEFPGYTKYWKDISADLVLPEVTEGQPLHLETAQHEEKQTQPPPRYTEPKLVQLMERKGIGRPSTYAPTIATLKQRNYVHLLKDKLQPTDLGLQVDAFLETALPDLLKAEFTAAMESSLDAIAEGQQEWQRYLIDWNHTYFEPALQAALNRLPEHKGNTERKPLEKSRLKCPKCGQSMAKVPSQKVSKGYFLKCEVGCQTAAGKAMVMFWSARSKKWQLPEPHTEPQQENSDAKRQQDLQTKQLPVLTEHFCPVCNAYLEEYTYQREGQSKKLLRCSIPDHRQSKCKEATYFLTRQGEWWSKKFGQLE